MNPPDSPAPKRLLGLKPVVAGTACCIVSAVGYAAANVCLRQLTELNCDPMWVICNKELVAVAVVGPFVLVQAFRGRRVLPPPRVLVVLVLIGLATQMVANLGFQWALGVIGLAVSVPVLFGVMITTGAAMGRFFLGEGVSKRSMTAIALLLVALLFLGFSAHAAGQSISAGAQPRWILAAVGAACLTGALYALLTVTIRHLVTGTTRVSTVVLIVTGMGVVTLGPLSFFRLGAEKLLSTPPEQVAWIAAAGMLNVIAFLALTKGLELTTVVRVNVLNAMQVAMCAVAGMMLFAEPPSAWLIFGVTLTIFGIILVGRHDDHEQPVDQHI